MPEFRSNCEDLWIKLELTGSKSLVIGGYYKPHEHDITSSGELAKSLEKVTKEHKNIWVAGDLNLPNMDWDSMSPTSECKHPTYYRNIAETLSDANLNQMVNLPTRVNNILDLFLTPNPTLVNHINIIPGISDHNIEHIRKNRI